MNKRFKILFLVLPILVLSFLRTGGLVFAETLEITVSGNGESSQNQAAVTSSNNTNVAQSNNAEVTNNVTTNSNTGNNSASGNSGDASITTGNTDTSTTVANNNVNSNTAVGGDFRTDTFVNITDNGANSDNNVNVSENKNVNVNQSNNANIYNNIATHANTGGNSANDNNGKVQIITGNILASTVVTNKNINSNKVIGFGLLIDPVFNIIGNGEGSKNSITFNQNNNFNYSNNNVFNLTNLVFNDLNTGNNEANHNNGDVSITTGDIISFTTIENSGNDNVIVTPTPGSTCKDNCGGSSVPPSTTASGSSGSSNSSSGNGSSGPAAGSVLPATGSLWLYIMTLLCMIFLLTGWYLRFTTGVSPPARS